MLLYPETKSAAFGLIKQQNLSVTNKYPQQSNNSLKFSIASLLFNNNHHNNHLTDKKIPNETCNQQLKNYLINNSSNQLDKFLNQSDLSLNNNQLNIKICNGKTFCEDYFCVKCSSKKSTLNNSISSLEVNTFDNNSLNVVDDDSLLDELLIQTNFPQSICLQDSLANNYSINNNNNLLNCSQNQNFEKKAVFRAMIMNMNKNELTSNFVLNKKLCKLTNQFCQKSHQTANKISIDQTNQSNNSESNFSQVVPINLNKNFFLNETPKIVSTNNKTSSVGKLNSSSIGNKKKRIRTIFSPEQLEVLEYHFRQKAYMVGHERLYLASSLNLSEAQVKVWFQNRRIKSRKFEVEKKNLF